MASECQSGNANYHKLEHVAGMKVTTVAINLAKSLFQVPAVDERRKSAVKKRFKSNQMIDLHTRHSRLLTREAPLSK